MAAFAKQCNRYVSRFLHKKGNISGDFCYFNRYIDFFIKRTDDSWGFCNGRSIVSIISLEINISVFWIFFSLLLLNTGRKKN